MLVGHLLCGLVAGWLGALVSFLISYSLGHMLGIYVLGANLGVALSILWVHGLQAELDRTLNHRDIEHPAH